MARSIDEYKNELMEFYKRSNVNLNPESTPQSDMENANISETSNTQNYPQGAGRLSVFVTHSGGLYPVVNADVTVSDQVGNIFAKQKTNISGKTPEIELPAPSKMYSETPGPNIKDVAAFYNVRIDAEGFVSAILEGIPIFDGILSNQAYDMTYLSAANDTRPQVIRFSNQNTL